MNRKTYFIVMEDEVVVYASTEKEDAESYAFSRYCELDTQQLEEWGNDDPDENDIAYAALQVGADYHIFTDKVCFDSNKDEFVELSDGTEVSVSDIMEVLYEEVY